MFLTRTPAPALLAGMIRQRVMNITLTMFAVDDENVEDMYNWIEENITYDKISIGVHKNASRHHVHFGLTGVDLPTVKDQRKAYNRKGLNKVHPDIKLSMHKDPDEEDNKKCLGYCLKEYDKFSKIKYRDKINIDDEELESLRIYAHAIYCSVKYNENKKQERKEQGNERANRLEEYLNEHYKQFMTDEEMYKPEYNDVPRLYIELCKLICDFNCEEENKITWRWSDIANIAYSYMYRNSRDYQNVNSRNIILFQQRIKLKEK